MEDDTQQPISESNEGETTATVDPKDKTEYSQMLYVTGLLTSSVGVATALFLYTTPLYDVPHTVGLYIMFIGIGLTISSVICESRINSALDERFRSN